MSKVASRKVGFLLFLLDMKTRIVNTSTMVVNDLDDSYLILRFIEPVYNLDAGILDKLITAKIGDVISRNPDKPNGVTVSSTECVIALKDGVEEKTKRDIQSLLESEI